MAKDNRPSYDRRQTKPLPREELAPIAPSSDFEIEPPASTKPMLEETAAYAREVEDSIATMVRCPLCAGQGMTAAEIAATFEELIAKAREQA